MVVGDISTGTDVLVIGGGPGGYVAAIRAGQLGLDVTLVERDVIGGTCLNRGCIPSKALLSGTGLAHEASHAGEMGIQGDLSVDLDAMVDWKDGVVDQLTGGVAQLCEAAGVNVMEGTAFFSGAHEARVMHDGEGEGSEAIEFEHAIVATGSRPIPHPREEARMVTLGALWLPILVAAVLVFLASSAVWMVLPHHRGDFAGLPDEEAARDALAGAEPGQYHVPHTPDREAHGSEEIQRKMEEGPVAMVAVIDGPPSMGKQLTQWFVYCAGVSLVAAYLAGRTLAPGAEYLEVFRVTGTVAWVAYGAGYVGDAIWFGRPWGFSRKRLADGRLYGLLTAGAFGWLWPAA